MPVLAPVITRTCWWAMPGFYQPPLVRLTRDGGARPDRGSLPGARPEGGPLRELLPEGLPPGWGRRHLDPLHRAQAARRRAERLALVHALRGAGRRPVRGEADRARPGGGPRRLAENRAGGDRPRPRGRRGGRRGPRGGLGASLRDIGAAAVPPPERLDVPRPAAAHEAAEPGPGSPLRRPRDGRRPRARVVGLAGDGGPQLGRPTRRALDLAARAGLRRCRPGHLARRGHGARQAGPADDALDRQRRVVAGR